MKKETSRFHLNRGLRAVGRGVSMSRRSNIACKCSGDVQLGLRNLGAVVSNLIAMADNLSRDRR